MFVVEKIKQQERFFVLLQWNWLVSNSLWEGQKGVRKTVYELTCSNAVWTMAYWNVYALTLAGRTVPLSKSTLYQTYTPNSTAIIRKCINFTSIYTHNETICYKLTSLSVYFLEGFLRRAASSSSSSLSEALSMRSSSIGSSFKSSNI